MLDLNRELICRMAENYPKRFSRQLVSLWRLGKTYPQVKSILWLARHEAIQDMNIFFHRKTDGTGNVRKEEQP